MKEYENSKDVAHDLKAILMLFSDLKATILLSV